MKLNKIILKYGFNNLDFVSRGPIKTLEDINNLVFISEVSTETAMRIDSKGSTKTDLDLTMLVSSVLVLVHINKLIHFSKVHTKTLVRINNLDFISIGHNKTEAHMAYQKYGFHQ